MVTTAFAFLAAVFLVMGLMGNARRDREIRRLKDELARWREQSDDWQERGWDMGTKLDAAEDEVGRLLGVIAGRDAFLHKRGVWHEFIDSLPDEPEPLLCMACGDAPAMKTDSDGATVCRSCFDRGRGTDLGTLV